MVLESICDATCNANLTGMFAFTTPVITFTDGLCVAIICPELKKPERMQSAFVSDDEVKKISKLLQGIDPETELIDLQTKASDGTSLSVGSDEDDDLLPQAEEIVIKNKKASTSFLQRKLKIGYSRAARLIDILEERGIVGPQVGTKPREILHDEDE